MLLTENILNSIISEAIEDFLLTEMLRRPPIQVKVKPIDITLLTNHANRDRNDRFKKLKALYGSRTSDKSCPFGRYIVAFRVENGHSNGAEIHTITEFGVVVVQNLFSKEVVTFFQLRDYELDDYIAALKENGKLDPEWVVKFSKAKACCKIYWANEDRLVGNPGGGERPSNPHNIKNGVIMRHRKNRKPDANDKPIDNDNNGEKTK